MACWEGDNVDMETFGDGEGYSFSVVHNRVRRGWKAESRQPESRFSLALKKFLRDGSPDGFGRSLLDR